MRLSIAAPAKAGDPHTPMPQFGMDAQHMNGGDCPDHCLRGRGQAARLRAMQRPLAMPDPPTNPHERTALLGIACGAGAALFWAFGFVAARHGIAAGFAPADLVFHRFVWAGLAFLPLVVRRGDLGDVGWGRSLLLTATGGPPLALFSYAGFLFVPLAHGGVIQPSCAALGGLTLATLVLGEKLPARRALGAAVIVAGLAVIGAEAFATIGTHGLAGDLSFVTAGLLFATFATLLRRWRVAPTRAAAVTSVVALVDVPIQWLLVGFERMVGLGLVENLLQLLVQGIFAGAGATYLFARSVVLLGAGRAAVFPSLVPGFTLLIGALALAEMPSAAQLGGFAMVMLGFWLTQRR
jgi:drug/metabolite transporter (DMT)-like permease